MTTTTINEPTVPSARATDGRREGPAVNEADWGAGASTFEDDRANGLAIDQDLPRLLYELAVRLPAQPGVHALCVWLYEPAGHAIRLHVLMADLPVNLRVGMSLPAADSVAGWVWKRQQLLSINAEAETRFPEFARALSEVGIKSFCAIPLMIADRRIGVLGLASTRPEAFHDFKLQFLQRGFQEAAGNVCSQAALPGQIANNTGRREETTHLEEPVRPEDQFEGIIGRSAPLQAVLDQVKIVAPTDSTVLILGETGTGKELIASAVHNQSSRRNKPFVRVNCAAIPSGLLESELFGHERGAFTGAIARKIGRFELANGGTLFLDEIGDLPLELQPKFLRVLQEQEFERLGSTQTTHVDVRVVAATSRDLPKMVANREFRSDLYYRLKVFPVRLPALRERPEDIGLLVRHFVDQSARRMGKPVELVPQEAMQAFLAYSWPGNIRELQNFVERAVILSPGKVLHAPLGELTAPVEYAEVPGQDAGPKAKTLKDSTRGRIVEALIESNWVVGGPKGAAARLGLHRTTLLSKMQRLGISRAQA